ncbi:MAG: SDR family oxidoreductase [Acidimicrobiales bacterium]|nr:SDR family oxidoreductase [Acidimicrobiales bacterium]
MSLFDAFRYDGKRALVVGGATGMGAAVAELVKDAGAEVLNADRAPVTQEGVTALSVDLADRASIEALAAEVEGPIDALFSCAGVADGTPGIEKINFLGHRLLIELLLANGKLARGAAIGMISSAAGMGWRTNLEKVQTYLGIADFEEASTWAQDNAKADYMWSKMAVNGYVAGECMNLLKQGVRINAILPGPTDTPLAQANADTWLTFGADYREETGIAASTPLEQAYPLVFLCSDAAAGITGVTVFTDAGYHASGVTGAYETAGLAVGFLEGEF